MNYSFEKSFRQFLQMNMSLVDTRLFLYSPSSTHFSQLISPHREQFSLHVMASIEQLEHVQFFRDDFQLSSIEYKSLDSWSMVDASCDIFSSTSSGSCFKGSLLFKGSSLKGSIFKGSSFI